MASAVRRASVVVVGAGPVGLLLTVRLARAGIHAICLEASPEPVKVPKATHYMPPALVELERAGVLEEVRKAGYELKDISWRTLDGTILTKLGKQGRLVKADDPYNIIALHQHVLCDILMRKATAGGTVEIVTDRLVKQIHQDTEGVKITAESADGHDYTYEAPYVAGCDGGKSIVRELIGQNLEGHTWPYQVVSTNTSYPFEQYGYDDSNFIIDKENWYMAAKLDDNKPSTWRVTYGEVPGLTNEQIRERLPAKFATILPGAPKDRLQYEVKNFAPYKVHQRIVDRMTVGRVSLAGDSAHLNSPFGGLGLTNGMIDAGKLADCYYGILRGMATPAILEKYSVIRRKTWVDVVNPVSSANMMRLPRVPREVLKDDEFIIGLQTGGDAFRDEMMRGLWTAQQDFTQFYDQK